MLPAFIEDCVDYRLDNLFLNAHVIEIVEHRETWTTIMRIPMILWFHQ